jgi:hypothetical protein
MIPASEDTNAQMEKSVENKCGSTADKCIVGVFVFWMYVKIHPEKSTYM